MVVPPHLVDDVQRVMTKQVDNAVKVTAIAPIDHPIYGETVFRASFDRDVGPLGSTAIVKRRRDTGSWRSEIALFNNEIAALTFLTQRAGLGTSIAPRLIAADATAGIIAMEDMGTGPSLEDVLFARDSDAAMNALVAFAVALGEMHAATAGADDDYYLLRREARGFDVSADRWGIFEHSIGKLWEAARAIIAERPELPQPPISIGYEIEEIQVIMEDPGPWLVFSNGDPCPANTRLADGKLRFLDFEHAGYHHALLDLTSLHLPFPACPCWSRMPQSVATEAIRSYRQTFAKRHPPVIDDEIYYPQLAANCMAWAIQRLIGLPKRDAFDEPHPVGFSRRGQLIATIEAAVGVARRAESLPELAAWLAELGESLEARWSDAPMNRPLFPAFAGCT